MWKKLQQIWQLPDLRNKIIFVLAMLVIFRVAGHIPVPGVNVENLRLFFRSNQILGLMNVFSGGTMESFSIVALGVAPYITSSIIFQLLTMIVPKLEELSKEGEYGRQKINQYTRILTVPLAALQSYAMIMLLRQSSRPIITDLTPISLATTVATVVGGTVLLMWIGELISEKKIGNGISLLIFAGIVANLPTAVSQAWLTFDSATVANWVIYAAIAVITVVGVVVITQGTRNIPVSYAKQIRGNRMYGGTSSYLPLRVNMAGVIPIIFAISIILFPSMIAQFFVGAKTALVAALAQKTLEIFQNQLIYGIIYFFLVVAFTYFYTAIIFRPDQIAEHLQKQGGFIPGIRPGNPTVEYLGKTINRVILAGALFLGILAVLPLGIQQLTGTRALTIGGTSLLIVVSVVIETVEQIESQLLMREYETS